MYRRITSETESRLKEIEAKQLALVEERVNRLVQLNLEYQEEFATKFTDQIVGAHLEIEKFSALIGLDDGPIDDEKYSNEFIAKLLSRISRESKMTQLAAEYQIPLRNILIWRSKYNQLDAEAIGRMRQSRLT
jgi:DNA-binding phage protein